MLGEVRPRISYFNELRGNDEHLGAKDEGDDAHAGTVIDDQGN